MNRRGFFGRVLAGALGLAGLARVAPAVPAFRPAVLRYHEAGGVGEITVEVAVVACGQVSRRRAVWRVAGGKVAGDVQRQE